MRPDILAIASAFGLGSVFGMLVKHYLVRLSERRKQRIATDRATYQERMTRLIAANLCALIRSNRYRDGEKEELEHLVQELSDGAHQVRFLDPKVQTAWARLVKKSAEYGWRRLAEVVTEQDVADYTKCWEAWLTASRESFGPLPETDRPMMRRQRPPEALEQAA